MRRSLRTGALLLTLVVGGGVTAAAQQPSVGRPDTSEVRDSAARVDEHPQDSPDDRGIVIRTADDKLWVRLLGSLRTLATYDFEGMPGIDNFSPYNIPVPDSDSSTNRFNMNANLSRIGLEATSRRGENGHTLFARIEADFRGEGNTLRLRHAFVRFDERFLLGQTWTTFTDASMLPLTVDLDGPNSSVTLRTVQLRLAAAVGKGGSVAASIESPSTDIQPSDSLKQVYQSFPDVIARYRLVRPGFRIQVAGVLRVLSVTDVDNRTSTSLGYGGNVMAQKDLGAGHQLSAQVIVGSGISRYITGFAGRGLDLLYDPETGTYVPLGEFGAYLAYGRLWPNGASTNVVLGSLVAFEQPWFAGSFYKSGGYLAVNHFIPLVAGARIGAEVVGGIRRNVDGQSGDAVRLQALILYDF
jgi:hypothetical protein